MTKERRCTCMRQGCRRAVWILWSWTAATSVPLFRWSCYTDPFSNNSPETNMHHIYIPNFSSQHQWVLRVSNAISNVWRKSQHTLFKPFQESTLWTFRMSPWPVKTVNSPVLELLNCVRKDLNAISLSLKKKKTLHARRHYLNDTSENNPNFPLEGSIPGRYLFRKSTNLLS